MQPTPWFLRALLGALAITVGCNLVIGVEDYKVATTTGQGGTSTIACTPSACPIPKGECKQAACSSAGLCVEEDIADGMPSATQIAGDCKKNVCKAGSAVIEDDPADVEDDSSACTSDSCNAGTPLHSPAKLGDPCSDNGGKVCNDTGACVGCNVDDDCKGGSGGATKCGPAHTCIPASCGDQSLNGDETDTDCGGPICDKCLDSFACKTSSDCQSNNCGPDSVCVAGTCDDKILNNDQLGETDVDCGGSTCKPCGFDLACALDADCIGGQCAMKKCAATCTDTTKDGDESDVDCGGACSPCANDLTCNMATDCASNFCKSGTCADCATNGDCGAGQFCTNKICKSDLADGTTCNTDAECMSGHCVDSVCCDSACTTTCQACNLAGLLGKCSNIPKDQQDYFPVNACAGNNHCSGAGACIKADGQSCASGAECASKSCVDGVCCENTCSTTCKSCNLKGSSGKCMYIPLGSDDNFPLAACTGTKTCNGAGACELANGEKCAIAAACSSNYCVDGLCCNSSCTGTCRACDVLDKAVGLAPGSCSYIQAGSDIDAECNSPTPYCSGSGICGPGGKGVNCIPFAVGACANGSCDGVTHKCP